MTMPDVLRKAGRVFVVAAVVAGTAAVGGHAQGAQPTPARVVLSTMHAMNQMSMQLGQMAQQRGTRRDVRAYGERLFRDHRFADCQVQRLAARRGRTFLPPQQLPAAPKLQPMMAGMQQLMRMQGAAFDGMFLQMAVQSHEMALGMLSDARNRLAPGPVRQLVSRLLPIVGQQAALGRALQSAATAP